MAEMGIEYRSPNWDHFCESNPDRCNQSNWPPIIPSIYSSQTKEHYGPDGTQPTTSTDLDAQSTPYDDTASSVTPSPVLKTTTSFYPHGTILSGMSASTSLPDGAVKSQPNTTDPNSAQNTDAGKHQPPVRIMLAAMIPLAIVIGFVVLACICLRRHRRRNNQKHVLAQMEYRPTNQAFQGVYSAPLQAQHQPQRQIQPQALLPSPAAAAPIVISSMAPAMGSAYFTGIDTSDTVSVVSNNVHGTGYGYDAEQGDEPPPPYRPRSLPPVSRETSVRQGEPSRDSQTHLIAPHGPGRTVSPFDDPDDDDDAVSMISGMDERLDRHQDDVRSEVSDISYQDPTTTHQTV